MTAPPPNPAVTSNLLTTQNALIHTLTSFLIVALHQILYLRRIYPPVSFLSARAYNFPVRQNRHPAVCQWVQSAIDAVRDQLEKGTVERVAVCIFECGENQVLERWTFDLRAFPVVEARERDTTFETGGENALRKKVNVADLEAQFRAVLSRVNSAAARLKSLPEDQECSFTVTIEVKDDADRPVGRMEKEERKWIAAEPEAWSEDDGENNADDDRERISRRSISAEGKTVAVRRLEAGELRMEVWVEESKAKFTRDRSASIDRSSAP